MGDAAPTPSAEVAEAKARKEGAGAAARRRLRREPAPRHLGGGRGSTGPTCVNSAAGSQPGGALASRPGDEACRTLLTGLARGFLCRAACCSLA